MQNSGSNNGNGLMWGLLAGAGTIAATLYGLHKIGKKERKIDHHGTTLLAAGQRLMGNKEDAAKTDAANILENINEGAKKVVETVGSAAEIATAAFHACKK